MSLHRLKRNKENRGKLHLHERKKTEGHGIACPTVFIFFILQFNAVCRFAEVD